MYISRNVLSNAGVPQLIEVATVYTNLTDTVFLIAERNNSLLNCKGLIFIYAHHNLSSNIGDLQENTLTTTTITAVGSWFNFTSIGYFYSIQLRQITNAMQIEEIAAEVEIYEADVAYSLAMLFVVQGALGGIVATAIFGRWKMNTIQK